MSSSSTTPPITAGTYLRLRREAQGLSLEEITAGCALPANRAAFLHRLHEIEGDRDVATGHTLAALRDCFAFSTAIYANLVAGVPAGAALCRACACSWNDPCGSGAHACHWVEPDLCSRCAAGSRAEKRAEPAFTLRASDPHAIALLSILAYLRLGEDDAARRELESVIADGARRRAGCAADQRAGQDLAALALDMTEWSGRNRAAGRVAHA
jgi:hypothetical protein